MDRPLTSTSPASLYVGINQSITYGFERRIILSSASGIVDTGTTLILVPSGSSERIPDFHSRSIIAFYVEAFSAYQQATGGTLDSATGLLKITKEHFACLDSLFFHIGEVRTPFASRFVSRVTY